MENVKKRKQSKSKPSSGSEECEKQNQVHSSQIHKSDNFHSDISTLRIGKEQNIGIKDSAVDTEGGVKDIARTSDKKLTGLCCRGLRPANGVLDRDLWEWYCDITAKDHTLKVTKSMVQARAKRMYHEAGILDFKASDGWYRRWMKRWKRFGYFSDTKADDSVAKTGLSDEKLKLTSSNIEKGVNRTGDQNNESDVILESALGRNECSESNKGEELSGCSFKTSLKHRLSTDSSTCKYVRLNDGRPTSTESGINDPTKNADTNNPGGTESENMLSTPMLNIVDYLPPEIMHNFQNNLSDKLVENISQGTNSNTLDNVFPSEMDASMDCLYYPSSYGVLSDCSNEELSTMESLPFEIQQSDSASSVTNETERLKDLVGFISSQQNCSPNMLRSSSFNNISENENIISACPSEDSEDIVDSVFRSVALNMDRHEENSNGSTNLASAVNQDVLAPEVILESQPSHTAVSKKPAVSKKSKKKVKESHMKSVAHRKKGERYLPQFKLKVLAYATTHTLKETSHKYKVNDGTIISWRKERIKQDQLAQNSKPIDQRDGIKETPVNSIDHQFLTWLRRCREQKRDILRNELLNKGKQLLEQGTLSDCHWFKMWVDRFEEKKEEDLESSKRRQERHIQYPQAFKIEVASYALLHSQLEAARIFNVSRKRVFDWLRIFRDKILKVSDSLKDSSDRFGKVEEESPKRNIVRRTDLDKDVDQQVWTWYEAQQKRGIKPNWHEVQAKGLELYRERGNEDIKCSYRWYKRWSDRFSLVLRHEGDDALLEWALTQLELGRSLTFSDFQSQALSLASDNAFKASRGWAIRFCKRHPELLQQNPILDTPLPSLLVKKVEKFRQEVQQIIQDRNLSLGCVGNMDELYLNFSVLMLGSNTKRQLLVRKSEMENCHATIVLSCLADGNILPPAIIVKTGGYEDSCETDGVVVLQQEEGLMDATCLVHWLQHVWFKQVSSPNILMMDCLESHIGDAIGNEFSKHSSTRLVIPGGCTSKLQPLDISLKNLFHAYIQKQWLAFNSRSSGQWDAGENKLHLPGCKDIVEWVSAAYRKFQSTEQETVRRSFLVTGLTVSQNRTEDHFIENLSMIPKSSSQT